MVLILSGGGCRSCSHRLRRPGRIAYLPRAALGTLLVAPNKASHVFSGSSVDQLKICRFAACSGEELSGPLVYRCDICWDCDMAGLGGNSGGAVERSGLKDYITGTRIMTYAKVNETEVLLLFHG